MKTKLYTLVLIREATRVLLGMKKRGFGCGKWNGFGGKVHVGESIIDCARRELEEECSVKCTNLDEVGMLEFEFIGEPTIMEVHVFKGNNFSGTPVESDEMRPAWFALDSIPFDKMWADDKLWLPMLLRDEKFRGFFRFRKEEIVDYTLNKVEQLNYADVTLKEG